MITKAEPVWEVPRHKWYEGNPKCSLCGVERAAEPGTCLWEPVLVPCLPRLAAQVAGFYTAKEAATKLGITYATFINRVHRRNFLPAAIGHNNVFFWREEQLKLIAPSEGDYWEHFVP